MLSTTIGRLRLLALIEGISYVLLLGVAMPLKYKFGMPIAVRIVGSAHGALFVLLCLLLLHTMISVGWSLKRGALVFVSAVVPLGTFVMDKHIKRWDEEDQAAAKG